MGSFSIWHWLIVLAIVVLVFGTKKLKNIGSDLGSAIKGFKDGMSDAQAEEPVQGVGAKQINSTQNDSSQTHQKSDQTIDVAAKEKP